MQDINEITILVKGLASNDKKMIEKACLFAQNAHNGQLRKSGEPYFVHVFATAKNLAELNMSPIVICAGFLHDVLEDTSVTEKEMEDNFGNEVTMLVNGVTKLGTVRYKGIERNVENLRKFFVSIAEDPRVLVIKLADRLHNIETLQHVAPEKQKRIALETLEVYAPLANRLSMGNLKSRLEDAAFAYAYPKECEEVKKLIAMQKDANKNYLNEVQENIALKLKEQSIENRIDYRVKHLYSLWKKLQKYDMDMGKIYDTMAIRVMVENVEQCYHVLGIIHGSWKPLPGRIKDYIANPKPNGYKSIHTTIFTGTGGIVEVQIRTHQMHDEAEYGIAAHFIYKEKTIKKNTEDSLKNYEWVNQLREMESHDGKPEEFLKTIKMDFFKDRVFAFSPKGDIIDLPEESCAIDFAYAIHSDIGNHAQGCKINGKNSHLHTKLKNHDIVEIIINKKANPSSKWLEYVKTTMAKKHINVYLRDHSLLAKFKSFGNF